MKFPFYKQHDSMDCGPTCLKMVAAFYGKNISLETLRYKAQIGKEGVNLLGIGEAAESIGFRTRATRIDYATLVNDALLPAILHWDQNHFVALYKVSKNRPFSFGNKAEVLYVADPARGLMKYSAQEFKEHWFSIKEKGAEEGVALLLESSPAFHQYKEDDKDKEKSGFAFKSLLKYIIPYKKLIAQLFLGLLISSTLQLLLPFLTQSIVDAGINSADLHFIYIILLGQLALFTGRLVVEFVRGWILLHISTRINVSILTDFLIKMMRLPIAFFDSKKTGDIMQRMKDHERIESFLTGSSVNVLFSMVNLIIFSVVLALFNTEIFIVFILATVLYSIWVIIFLDKRRKLDYKRFDVASREQSMTIQLIQGMQEIKLNGAERPMRWSWERLQAKLFRLSIKGLIINQWQQAGAFFINEGKNIFITFLSAKAVIDGDMTLGGMLAVQYIIGQLNSPVEQMLNFIRSWQFAKISIERLNEIHSMDNEEPLNKPLLRELPRSFTKKLVGGVSGMEMEDVLPAITFRNVSFTYPGAGNEPVLRNINLQIPKGKKTAVVGVSGSGKTTLLKLLLKFYSPQDGDIIVADTAFPDISHTTWRSHCGIVMQESFIFSDTIAKNIAVGAEDVNMERLNKAIDIANIREFINGLPSGINTKIGTEGTGISMGQKQRILIARAVYRNPEFIFFDEATNSLDANNESKIVHNLESFLEEKTVVIVAHRLSTVKDADQIVVLNKGVIVECGTHQELVNLKGEYYTLVKNQLELGE